MYTGYPAMPLTTHDRSKSTACRPARFAAMPAARPQGPAPTIATSTTSCFDLPTPAAIASDRRVRADDLVAPGADAHEVDGRLAQLGEPVEVGARLLRQRVHRPAVLGRSLPAGHPLVPRHERLERRDVAGKLGVYVAAILVSGAQREAVEGVEHVELRHREPREAVDARGVADDDGVEPAAAARTSRRRAELVAEPAHPLAEGLVELRRQWSVADARRVRLDD